MTKKLRLVLIALFAFIACTCIFAGCTLRPSLDDILDDLNKKGAIVAVTYFANDGNFNDKVDKKDGNSSTDKDDDNDDEEEESGSQDSTNSNIPKNNNGKIRTIHYKVGDKALYIDSKNAEVDESGTHGSPEITSGTISIAASDSMRYELAGWHEAVTDENGNPLYEDGTPYVFNYDNQYFDSSKKIVHKAELFDFSQKLENKHYYLVAAWRKIQSLHVLLAGEASSITVGEKNYKKGDLLNDIPYDSDDLIRKPNAPILDTVSDATFIEYYADEECTQLFDGWPLKYEDHKDDDIEHPFTIYAKYIEGIWTVVKNALEVSSMFGDAVFENRYYIFNDINCGGMEVDALNGYMGFACEIRGNGYTISNFKVSSSITSSTPGSSLFGQIKNTAKISNLNLKDITQEYKVYSEGYATSGIFFAFTSIEQGAVLEGVTLSGTMTVTIYSGGYANNLVGGATNHWKFGGYTNDSDYTGGITVTDNTTLTIN